MYVDRDENNEIVATFARPQYDGQEFVKGAEITKKWKDVRALQQDKIQAIKWRVERYDTQKALDTSTNEKPEKYAEILQYMQDVRDCDESNYDNADAAIDALNALVKP